MSFKRLFPSLVLTAGFAVGGVALGGCAQGWGPFGSGKVTALTGSAAANAKLETVRGGPAKGRRDSRLETVATFDSAAQLVGVAVSKSGRTFVLFPRWADKVDAPVMELVDGELVPYPDAETNRFDPKQWKKHDPRTHFVSPQAIVFDDRDRLWVLDPGSINFGPNLPGGPKLWCYDINTRQRVGEVRFPGDVALKSTALNDVRFDLNRGPEGTAYITDSGAGGIIVVDLASGRSWRRLDGHPSVMPTPGLEQRFEGEPFVQRKPSKEVAAPDFRADGIALSPDGSTLYYNSVNAREIYAVPTALLANPEASSGAVAGAVRKVASKPSGNDGMICDGQGRIYSTDFEDNAIRRTDPTSGESEVLVQDERLIWPDTLCWGGGNGDGRGDLYITVNQLARQGDYHFGKDLRKRPWVLFRLRGAGAGAGAGER